MSDDFKNYPKSITDKARGVPFLMKLPVLSDGTTRELVYPGALLTKEQAKRYGDRKMPKDLKSAGFRTHIFTSDPDIHGFSYYRITYGKEVKSNNLWERSK